MNVLKEYIPVHLAQLVKTLMAAITVAVQMETAKVLHSPPTYHHVMFFVPDGCVYRKQAYPNYSIRLSKKCTECTCNVSIKNWYSYNVRNYHSMHAIFSYLHI